MHRFLRLQQRQDAFPFIQTGLATYEPVCYACFQRFQQVCHGGRRTIHTTVSNKVQYTSALKYLLTKKAKKVKREVKNKKIFDGTENVLERSTDTVNIMRGSRLISLPGTVGARLESSKNLQFIPSSLQMDATVKHYDPLVVLPTDDPNAAVEEFLKFDSHTKDLNLPSTLSVPSKTSALLKSISSKISIPSVIHDFHNASKNGKQFINVYIGDEAKIKDLHEITLVGDEVGLHVRQELRRKLRLRSAEEIRDDAIIQDEIAAEGFATEEVLGYDPLKLASEHTPQVVAEAKDQVKEKKKTKRRGFKISLKKKTREAVAKQKLQDLEKLNKEESLNGNFSSYVDVCVHTGNAIDAFIAIKAYRRKLKLTKEWTPKVTNIEIYNAIIAGLAKDGLLKKINDLIGFAEEDGLSLNAYSYAGVLDCHIMKNKKNPNSFADYLAEIESKGININEVLLSPHLSVESYDRIIANIKQIRPDFKHELPPLDLNYTCKLLEHLNHLPKKYSSPIPQNMNAEDLKARYKEQLELEMNNYVKVKTIEKRTEPVDNVQHFREKLNKAHENWKETVSKAFDRDLEVLMAQCRQKSHFFFTIYPYLVAIPKEDHVEIILQEIRKLSEGSETYSPTTKHLYRELGTQVCLRYQTRKKQVSGALDQLNCLFEQYCDWYASPDTSASNTREKWQQLLRNHVAAARLCGGEPLWRSHVLTEVGRFLYNIVIRDVKIDANCMRLSENTKEHMLPAFYTLFRTKGHVAKEEVKPHPTLSRLFRAAAPEDLVFEVSKIPMACPPQPWNTITSGGNLVTKTELIRLPFQAVAQWKTLEKTPVNNLYPSFDSLNQLGAVPWMVNNTVLDVMLEVFNSGGSSKLDVPEPPSACPPADPVTNEMTQHERFLAYRQRLSVRRRKAEMYSLWCDALYKLSLANHFRDRIFWLPHNMDFRGRVYPVAPHLNHLGSDLSRALLVFAKGQPLGADGFNWLKIHAINLTGTHKKKSIDDRLAYANEILDDILDSAEKPLTGKMWWAESEEPWQTLATCCEIRNALASGNPAEYVSGFPVHQDGSCNGLQHYAALGRDQAGGESVNLTPAPIPQDVYSCVVNIVERERAKDAANGLAIAQILEGFIYRKVIKQTVMTTVYGVTRFGARLQIARQLKDLDDFPKQHVWPASMYLVSKTFESLQEMFTSTKEIQDWFTECARLVAQVCGENVEWVTPLGLPIVQPYSRGSSHHQLSTIDHIKFIGVQASTLADAFERPNIMKQKNAFAPNFVHSLDSSHMMLTSLFCERAGVNFVSIHDCYWTHACTVPQMNKICRDQFVALHSQPILKNLSEYFVNRFGYPESMLTNDGSIADLAKRNLNRALRSQPTTGSLDLSNVLESSYFFS